MSRAVLRLILDVVLTIAVAVVFLTLWQWFLSGSIAEAPAEALRVLFNFMDVGLGIWVILLIVALVRGRARGAGPAAGLTWVFALVGAVVNLIVVTVVGFIQGGWAPLLILFAIEAGIAVLVAAAIVVPIVHRLVRNARVRVLAVAILMLALGGCAVPGDEPAQVELEGTVTAVMAGSGDDLYVLDVPGRGLLPLDVGDQRPPLHTSGVIVEVPDGVTIPDDADGRFEALAAWVAESEQSLVVVDFLTP